MDKHTIITVFKKYLHPLNGEIISKMVDIMKLDKYVKKLDTLTFAKLFIFAQINQLESLKLISNKVKRLKKLQKELGLKSISQSQLSRKLSDIPSEIFQAVLQHLVQQVHREFGKEQGDRLLGKIHLIDSSTISFCLSQYKWAVFRSTKGGIKVHTRVVLYGNETTPDKIIVTPARPADVTQLDSLMVIEQDALHVFDRGYFDFEKFDEYCKQNSRFCTRIKDNTIVHVIEEIPVDPSSNVLREAIVKLGNMRYPLRLVETLDSQGNKLSIVINDAKMSAGEISDLYRKRWQIELFFKWMKQHLKLKKMYGKSQNAVYNQVYIAMITFCLTLLMKKKVHYQGTLLDMLDYIVDYWSNCFITFLKALFKKPERSSFGRRKLKHEQIFQDTLAQYEEGEVDHLNDLTYDPIL
ncbi:IS4 family transposase [Pullulanibacillus sp. KACC 23026]|uniref:IS4 family transposase n=1 Tax=Pullulanibacillus sp. KACC 23026 TaxID=3028315 RepID=UPI0023AFF171|nr:IS4 family transposase [Pullulanibacillus sp. KACC 23026]WEG10920.1 IS4 family transposase [Pullulanibacillus sp. KACC 23026]